MAHRDHGGAHDAHDDHGGHGDDGRAHDDQDDHDGHDGGAHALRTPPAEPLNPFQLDDPDDPVSDDDDDDDRSTPVPFVVASEADVPLDTRAPATPPTPAAKPQPRLPAPAPADTPPLYIPGLVAPGLFLPIPNTDPLTTLMTKYVPDPRQRIARDVSGVWTTRDFHTLVMSNHWRALAQMARDRIVSASANDLEHILSLWYLRLSSLARLRLFNQTATECTNLFAVLHAAAPPAAPPAAPHTTTPPAPHPPHPPLLAAVLPFELEVLHARVRYWAGDHMGYLDALVPLLRECKVRARAAGAAAAAAPEAAASAAAAAAATDGGAATATASAAAESAAAAMWRERGTRVSLIIASQLVEMRDFGAAARFLEPLCVPAGAPALRSAIARIYLQGGDLGGAARHFAAVDADARADAVTRDMNRAVQAAAAGEWARAVDALERVLAADPDDALAANNLAVALLSAGRVEEGIRAMEGALRANPIAVTATEPWLFNLATLYELRSTTTWEKKRDLLIDVAKWSGDGLKTSCLKLPAV